MKNKKSKSTQAASLLCYYPLLRKNVMLYRDKETYLLINPYAKTSKKLSRVRKEHALLLRQLNGKKTLKDICAAMCVGQAAAVRLLKKWAAKECDMVELLRLPIAAAKRAQGRMFKYCEAANHIAHEMCSAARLTSGCSRKTKQYHRRKIYNAFDQFEKREVTNAHIYRDPHPLLQGKSYGESFADVLMRQKAIGKDAVILEIGGGVGFFAKSFLDRVREKSPHLYKRLRYVLLDISPVLLNSQKKILKCHGAATRFIRADTEEHHFGAKRFDVVISNEMIADMTVVQLKKSSNGALRATSKNQERARALIKQFRINVDDAPKRFLFNLGAVVFLQQIKKMLKPGGRAYVVEYGSPFFYPTASPLHGHTEYAVHFGVLKHVAQKLGLRARLRPLIDFLPFDRKASILTSASWFAINEYLLPFLHRKKRSDFIVTKAMLEKELGDSMPKLYFVGFSHLGKKEIFLDPADFFVLAIQKKNQ